MKPLTADLSQDHARPYFLWDENLTTAKFRRRLQEGSPDERDRLLGKLLREARDIDVWRFVKPEEVAAALPRLGRRVGRRLAFWQFLIEGWRHDGLLD